jgi:hypothetical protein
MIVRPSIEELLAFFDNPYPCLETLRDMTVLRRDTNVYMVIPPLNRPLGVGMFSARLPPQLRLDLCLAYLRQKGPDRLDGPDLYQLMRLLEEARR